MSTTTARILLILWLCAPAASVVCRELPLPSPAAKPQWAPQEGASLLGTPAPAWQDLHWLSGGPLSLETLRGKTVLVRFWLAGCPYCTRTLPVLEELSQRYRHRGLVVIGLYHPKGEAESDSDTIQQAARQLGMSFPIAVDTELSTLRAYGYGTTFTRFTSLSFLVDRQGVIRFVHDGGEYHPSADPEHAACNAAYKALVDQLERLLAKSPP